MPDVQFIGITMPSAITDCHTPGELIAYMARVSNPANQNNTKTAPKLLSYLLANKHWSPFEMVHMVLQIDTTRDIGRQILRHRSFAFQEFSQRYAKVRPEDDGFTRECRLQDPKNRQASISLMVPGYTSSVLPTHELRLNEDWRMKQREVANLADKVYDWALRQGIAKEQARVVLPEGLTKSTMYMSGSIRSWIHWIDVRTGAGTQKEHRELAEQAKVLLLQHIPELTEYFDRKRKFTDMIARVRTSIEDQYHEMKEFFDDYLSH